MPETEAPRPGTNRAVGVGMRIRILLACLTFFVPACSTSVSEDGVDEGETRIDPTGTDSPGKFTVKLPSGAAHETKVAWNGVKKSAGELFDPVPVGVQAYTMTSGSVTSSGNVKIEAGKTTTELVALLAIDAASGPRTLGLRTDTTGMGLRLTTDGRSSLGGFPESVAASPSFAVLGSANGYELNFGLNAADGIPVKLAPGESKKFVLADPTARRTVRIKAPSDREMANATCGTPATSATVRYELTHNLLGAASAGFSLDKSAEIDVGLAPSQSDQSVYYLRADAWRSSVPLPMPVRGAPMGQFALGRVDVNDVLINATQPRVPGTYRIYKANAQGQASGEEVLRCAAPTNTGVDLPAGKYVVRVSYPSVESGTKVDEHVLTVP